MNRQLSALLLAAFAFSFTSSEAKAQSQTVDKNALPQADQFYHHRKKIQIVNENPDITNTMRQPEAKQILLIPTPQLQNQQVQYIMAPSASGPGLPPGAVDLSGPPPSGFTSNMPLNPNAMSKRNSLPQGQTTGGLTGKSLASGRMFAPQSSHPISAAAPTRALPSVGSTQPMAYNPYNSAGTSGASATKATSSVSAKIERGSLIGRTQGK